jgi:translation initiation factor 1
MAVQKTYRSFSELGQLSGSPSPPISQPSQHDGKGKQVRLALDTHGRRGKIVTMISGLQHNPATMEEIARALKQFCGTGGTVKGGTIELQGDQRERAAMKLKELHYTVV